MSSAGSQEYDPIYKIIQGNVLKENGSPTN